jgi:hypothetical protein
MKYYSTSSAHMTLLRKEGHYMSDRTARLVAKKLAVVLELSIDLQIQVEHALSLGMGYGRDVGLTPAELTVINDLIAWYSFDETSDGVNPYRACFIACNLNRGLSLVISERKAYGTPVSLSALWKQSGGQVIEFLRAVDTEEGPICG